MLMSMTRVAVLAAAFAFTSFQIMPATAAADVASEVPEARKTLPPWIVTCSNQNPNGKLRCIAEQGIFVASTRKRVIGIVLERNPEEKLPLRARVQLPHGILLSAGLRLWIDEGKKRAVDITYADSDGSYALFPIDEALAKEMRTGKLMHFQVTAASGKVTQLELTLDGLAVALKYVEEIN